MHFLLLKLCEYIPKSLCFTLFERSGIDSLSTVWTFWKIDYATRCRFSNFTLIRQGVIVIHAKNLRRDIHGFQTGLHVMIRWVMQLICFDFNNTRHVIAGNFSAKLHGRFICHIWIQYRLCITTIMFLLYVHCMFHLHLLLPLYSSLMIKYFMKILYIYESILWKLIKDFCPRFTYSQQNCLDQTNSV